MSDNAMLDATLDYARKGWAVFPCNADKRPMLDGGFHAATCDAETIAAWWARWPMAAIGFLPASAGLVVLDVDCKHDSPGMARWTELCERHGAAIAETVTTRTPSGGLHLYYRAPAGMAGKREGVGALGDGIDVRHSSGYVILPPSRVATGGYTWLISPDEREPLDLPDCLFAMLKDRPQPTPSVATPMPSDGDGSRWLDWALEKAQVGNRNATGFALATQLRDNGVGRSDGERIMLDYAARVPQNGDVYSESEALASLASAYNAPARLPATALRVDFAPECEPLPEGCNEIPAMGAPKPTVCSSWAELAQELQAVTWHWERWLAPGFLHLLVSRSGLGKSTLALRIAASYLLGWAWPDGAPFMGETGAVVWCESESAQALNVHRAVDWQLPVERILAPLPNGADINLCNAAHRRAIEQAAKRDDVRLIILDSLSGARASQDENSSKVLESTQWLAALARDTGKPVLATHHLRKRGLLDGDGDAVELDRVRGSSAVVQLARVVWALDKPVEGDAALRVSVIKSNLAKFPEPLGMVIDDAGRVHFDGAPKAKPQISAKRQALLDALGEFEHGLTCQELAEMIERNKGSVYKDLQCLAQVGVVMRHGDTYLYNLDN